MPFTFSHAVLAPPLSKLSGGRLPVAALAIGCMTPDLYRILNETEIHLNHQWQGLIHPDLWVGLLFCFLWYCFYRPMLFRFLSIVDPLNIDSLSTFIRFSCYVILAVLLGTATHIIWDGFTHLDFRTIAFHETLAQSVSILGQNYPIHRVLQVGTSVIALPFLIWMSIDYLQKFRQPTELPSRLIRFSTSVLLISLFAGCFSYISRAKATQFHLQNTDLYHFIGFFLNGFSRGMLVSLTIGCIIFLILDKRRFFRIRTRHR